MNVHVFDDTGVLVRSLADELLKFGELRQTVHISLSGGSTPKKLFEYIAASPFCDSIAWEHLHFWWGDERCVSPDDSESNFGEADRLLFQKVLIPGKNLHRIEGELEPAEACEKFVREMKGLMPVVNGHPQFDWIILGIGEDGHTASLFPGQTDYGDQRSAVLASHPDTGQVRVSLTAGAIAQARRVSYLALGEGKQGVLARIFENPEKGSETLELPAARIRSEEGITEYFLDAAAAARLPQVIKTGDKV